MAEPRTIREVFDSLEHASSNEAMAQYIDKGLSEQEIRDLNRVGFSVYEGKVREVIRGRDKDLRVHHTDRLTAFDRLIGYVPFKGQILTDISDWWFTQLGTLIPNHYKRRVDERTLLVEALKPFKVEVVVRGYMAGSMMRAYEKGERLFCGVKLPEGLKPFGKLPQPIITPTTKAAAFEHDVDASEEDLIKQNVCTQEEWNRIKDAALKLFGWGSKVLAEHGWLLADTKYEFGISEIGEIKVIDEIHTPDSSRFWIQSTYEARLKKGEQPEMLDKENVRRFLLSKNFQGHGDVPEVPVGELVKLAKIYLNVAEKLRGEVLSRATHRGTE